MGFPKALPGQWGGAALGTHSPRARLLGFSGYPCCPEGGWKRDWVSQSTTLPQMFLCAFSTERYCCASYKNKNHVVFCPSLPPKTGDRTCLNVWGAVSSVNQDTVWFMLCQSSFFWFVTYPPDPMIYLVLLSEVPLQLPQAARAAVPFLAQALAVGAARLSGDQLWGNWLSCQDRHCTARSRQARLVIVIKFSKIQNMLSSVRNKEQLKFH